MRVGIDALTWKPIDRPSTPARKKGGSPRPRATSGMSRPRQTARVILAQLEPDADRRTDHGGTAWARGGCRAEKRPGKGAAHHHVARLVEFAKQAGVALDGAVGVDRGGRRKTDAVLDRMTVQH
jgi:hypothetical protein